MRKVIIMFALAMGIITANAQELNPLEFLTMLYGNI